MRATPIPAFVLLATTALLSSPAFSQGVQPATSATPAEPGFAKEMIPQAPIGHRQPTLRDIPKDENADIDCPGQNRPRLRSRPGDLPGLLKLGKFHGEEKAARSDRAARFLRRTVTRA